MSVLITIKELGQPKETMRDVTVLSVPQLHTYLSIDGVELRVISVCQFPAEHMPSGKPAASVMLRREGEHVVDVLCQ